MPRPVITPVETGRQRPIPARLRRTAAAAPERSGIRRWSEPRPWRPRRAARAARPAASAPTRPDRLARRARGRPSRARGRRDARTGGSARRARRLLGSARTVGLGSKYSAGTAGCSAWRTPPASSGPGAGVPWRSVAASLASSEPSSAARPTYSTRTRVDAVLMEAEQLRRAHRHVDHAVLVKRPAVVDAHDDRALVAQVGHPHVARDRQRRMRRRDRVHVEHFAVGGQPAVEVVAVPGRHALGARSWCFPRERRCGPRPDRACRRGRCRRPWAPARRARPRGGSPTRRISDRRWIWPQFASASAMAAAAPIRATWIIPAGTLRRPIQPSTTQHRGRTRPGRPTPLHSAAIITRPKRGGNGARHGGQQGW